MIIPLRPDSKHCPALALPAPIFVVPALHLLSVLVHRPLVLAETRREVEGGPAKAALVFEGPDVG